MRCHGLASLLSTARPCVPSMSCVPLSASVDGYQPSVYPCCCSSPALSPAVSPTVLEGAIRCGCTHLIVDVLLSLEERQQLATAARVVSAVQHLRRADSWRSRETPPAIVVSG